MKAVSRQFLVSDLHGCFDAFLAALEAAGFSFERGDRLRILGDAFDRGPQSREIYEWICAQEEKHPGQIAWQMGNHESMFIWRLEGKDKYGDFFLNGGWATVKSFLPDRPGAANLHPRTDGAAQEYFRRHMLQRYPDLLPRLRRLPLLHEEEDALFVHAGVNPAKPLRKQSENDLLWIREEWILAPYSGKTVVFGHTPIVNLQGHNLHPWAQPWFRPHPVIANKVGIDGGAAFEGGAILLVEWPSLSFVRIPTSGFRLLSESTNYPME